MRDPGNPQRRRRRTQAPEKPARPIHSEISTGLGPSAPPRGHARGRFAPPPKTPARGPVRGEHAAARPMDDWLHERMVHPDPKDELRVLGFQGASALQRARENMRYYIHTIHFSQPRAEVGHGITEHKLPEDFTGLTPEQIAEGKKAVGSSGIVSPETVLQAIGFRPTSELAQVAQHPIGAFQAHQEKVKEEAALGRQGIMPEMSLGIIPFGETPGARVGRTASLKRNAPKTHFAVEDLGDGTAAVWDKGPDGGPAGLAPRFIGSLKGAHERAAELQAQVNDVPQWARWSPGARGRNIGKTEVPKIGGGAPQKITREERRVTYHGLSAWFPTSPSRPTAYAQRLIDRFSEHLSGPVDVLRASSDWKRYRLGQLLTPASSRGRVPKVQATRSQRLGARRARGRTAQEHRVLQGEGHFMGHSTNQGEQMAHAVWIQLPESHRNVGGLKLWRDYFLHHSLGDLRDLSPTGFKGRVESYIEDEVSRMNQEYQAGNVVEANRVKAHIADLNAIIQDIPGRISDVQDEIKKFDQLIEKPPKYNPAVAEAASTLNMEAEEIMVREGHLDPEEATIRAGKVSKGLGLQPSGEEVYVHHSLMKNKTPMGAGAGAGRGRLPEGTGQHLGLVLARSGRVRLSLEPVIEHWQQAQSYELHGIMIDELGKMGDPLSIRPGLRPAKDDIVLNPKGRPKLQSWQRDPEVVALEESLDPEGFHIKNLDEALRASIAEGADRKQLIQDAIDAGQLDQLRVVPKDVFVRYVGQYRDITDLSRLVSQDSKSGLGALRTGADAVNSMIYLSLIYANPGYIPANLVQNFLMHFAQAGVFAPIDLARTIQILQKATAEGRGGRMQRLRDQLRSEIGHGPTVEAASNIKISRTISSHVAMIPDDPLRMSAFIHEAARLGVIPKLSPVLREKDIAALEKLLNDKSMRGRLNDIQDRAVQAMVDFERLGPKERAILKRVMFVWSWTRGGTRYPFRFALDHPGRSAVLAYLFSGAPGAPQSLQDKIHQFMPTVQHGMPPWLEGALRVGTKTIGGKEYPVILPTRQISPVSQPWDILQTAISAPGAQTAGQLLNPAIPAGWHILNRESPYGRAVGSYGEAAWQEWQRLQPAAQLAGGLISPTTDTKLYPEDRTRWGRLKRSLRIVPYAVDLQEAEKARVRSGMTSTVEASFEQFKSDARKYLHHEAPPYVLHQAKVKLDLDHRLYKEARNKDRQIDYGKAVKIAAEVYEKERGHKIDLSHIKTQAQAHSQYLAILSALYPAYAAYQTFIDRHKAYERDVAPANG